MLTAILAALLAVSPAGVISAEVSPGCEDDNEETPCCPLENLELFSSDLVDWYACLDSVTLPIDDASLQSNEG